MQVSEQQRTVVSSNNVDKATAANNTNVYMYSTLTNCANIHTDVAS